MTEEKKLFTHPRWNNTELPEVTGHREPTEEDIAESRAWFETLLIKEGRLKDGEHLTDEEWERYHTLPKTDEEWKRYIRPPKDF